MNKVISSGLPTFYRVTVLLTFLAVLPALCAAEMMSVEERVAALKSSLATSQAGIRHYEWVETTVVSLKGDEKSRKHTRCYYGADGELTKIPLEAPPPEEKKRGLRGKIIERKKEELTDYMHNAVALVKSYIPPSPALIQAAKERGNTSVDVLPGKSVRVNFRDYKKPGDTLSVEVDMANNRLLGLTVKSYLEDEDDAVIMDAKFSQLEDGISYADVIRLDAKKKKVSVAVDHSGYRKK